MILFSTLFCYFCLFGVLSIFPFLFISAGDFKKSHSTHNLASSVSNNSPSLVLSPASPENFGAVVTQTTPVSANRSRSPKPAQDKVLAVTPVSTAPYNKYQRKSSPKIGVSSLAAKSQILSGSSHNLKMGTGVALSPLAQSPYTPMVGAKFSSTSSGRRQSSASLISDESLLLDSSSAESGFAEEANLVGLCTGNPIVI